MARIDTSCAISHRLCGFQPNKDLWPELAQAVSFRTSHDKNFLSQGWHNLCRLVQAMPEFNYKNYYTTENFQTKQNPTEHTQSREQNQGKILGITTSPCLVIILWHIIMSCHIIAITCQIMLTWSFSSNSNYVVSTILVICYSKIILLFSIIYGMLLSHYHYLLDVILSIVYCNR